MLGVRVQGRGVEGQWVLGVRVWGQGMLGDQRQGVTQRRYGATRQRDLHPLTSRFRPAPTRPWHPGPLQAPSLLPLTMLPHQHHLLPFQIFLASRPAALVVPPLNLSRKAHPPVTAPPGSAQQSAPQTASRHRVPGACPRHPAPGYCAPHPLPCVGCALGASCSPPGRGHAMPVVQVQACDTSHPGRSDDPRGPPGQMQPHPGA